MRPWTLRWIATVRLARATSTGCAGPRRPAWSRNAPDAPPILLGTLSQLIGSFRPTACTQLLHKLTDAEREALRSVRDRRNEVAHGGQSSVSLGQVDQYYTEIKNFLAKVAEVLA
jgi:hypothetical protein